MRQYTYVMGLLLPVFALTALLLLVVADLPAAYADFSKIRAGLDRGQLRVEGENATPGATITVKDAASTNPEETLAEGEADDRGRFRIETQVNSPSCPGGKVIISDGTFTTGPVSLDPCRSPDGGAAEPEPEEPAPPSNICTESQSCVALEIGLIAGPLAPLVVPTPSQVNPAPTLNTIPVPLALLDQLPTGTIAEFGIEGVLDSEITSQEWRVGNNLLVYPFSDTRKDKNPQIGDLVRVIALRTLEPGPIVAERIRSRGPGLLPAGPAACEISFLLSGVVTDDGGDVLTITTDFAEFSNLNIVEGLTERDDGIGEFSTVLVSFVVAANPVACP